MKMFIICRKITGLGRFAKNFALMAIISAASAILLNGQSLPVPSQMGEASKVPVVKGVKGVKAIGSSAISEKRHVTLLIDRPSAQTEELRVAADPNVNVKFCVANGNLKVNGWEREEVRVFIRSGRKFNIRVLEKNAATGKAGWLWITRKEPENPLTGPASMCLSGASIEMDVPTGALLNLEATSSDAVIDSVKRANVKIIEGNIFIRNVTNGVTAFAYQGDLVIGNSTGPIMAETTTGNIIAYGNSPGQSGDLFRARTNSGAISLQGVDHRQVEANSITGTVLFDGKLLPGGIYTFKTTNGSVRLQLPQDISCRVAASYGFGTFKSDFPMKIINETVSPGGKNTIANIGSGEATVNITTSSGSILFKKKP